MCKTATLKGGCLEQPPFFCKNLLHFKKLKYIFTLYFYVVSRNTATIFVKSDSKCHFSNMFEMYRV